MDQKYIDDVALFRYNLIAPVVSNPNIEKWQITAYFHAASKKQHTYVDGSQRSVSLHSLQRYHKAYLENGFEGLKPKGRSDLGKRRKVDQDLFYHIEYYVRSYPRMPATVVYQRLIENGAINQQDVSLSTINRCVKEIRKRHPEADLRKEYRRYECEHINEVWYGDSSVGPRIEIDGKMRKTWIIALIDDASRYIVGIDVFLNDNYPNLLSVIRQACKAHGQPQKMKFDNGSNYRSKQMELLTALMGSTVSYSPPRTPTGKAKIERWFRTMKDRWMGCVNWKDFKSLEDVRVSLNQFVQGYHMTCPAAKPDTNPMNRYYSESHLIRRYTNEEIKKIFLLEESRTSSRDGVIEIQKIKYELPIQYANQKVRIRYELDMSHVYVVNPEGGEYVEIYQLDMLANSKRQRTQYMFSQAQEDNETWNG